MKVLMSILNADFNFENSPARVTANRSCQEIKLAGMTIGPLEEGNEYETFYWVALELEKSGIIHFHEDESLTLGRLGKIQWAERVQTAGQITKLLNAFYPKLRRLLSVLQKESTDNAAKMLECEKAKQLAKDTINSRLRKIIAIASAPAQTEQTLKNLTEEERILYEQLYGLINEWRTQILKLGENE